MSRYAVWLVLLVAIGLLLPAAARGQYLNNYQTTYTPGGPFHEAVAFKQTSDGGYIYVGPFPGAGQKGSHLLLVKLDAAFAVTWSRTYFLPGEFDGSFPFGLFFSPSDVDQAVDKGYLVCGRVAAEGVFNAGFILRTDAAGSALWLDAYPSTVDLRSCVEVTPAASSTAGVLAVGDAKLPPGQAAIVRTDAAGNFLWGRSVAGNKGGQASYAEVIHYQGARFSLTGYANASSTDQDLILGAIDADGNFGFHNIYGQTLDNKGNRVFESGHGLVEVGGLKPGLAVTGLTYAVVPDV